MAFYNTRFAARANGSYAVFAKRAQKADHSEKRLERQPQSGRAQPATPQPH